MATIKKDTSPFRSREDDVTRPSSRGLYNTVGLNVTVPYSSSPAPEYSDVDTVKE